MRTRILLSAILLGTVMLPTFSVAQIDTSADACVSEINSRLAKEQRLYRRTLFGLNSAAAEQNGAVRYDTTGRAWIKDTANKWVTAPVGTLVIPPKNDQQMDDSVERDPLDPVASSPLRQGIFSMSGGLTSELIPSLTQSFRALQCRTFSVCEAVRASRSATAGTVTVQYPGCLPLTVPPLASCQASFEQPGTPADVTVIEGHCEPVANVMLDREAELLKVSVTYDASYRSLLQFAGNFDEFMRLYNTDLMRPIEQSKSLIEQLARIPCFISQCNE